MQGCKQTKRNYIGWPPELQIAIQIDQNGHLQR